MGRLDGKVAVISGAARGQGATEVRLFTREGAKVVFGDVLHRLGEEVEGKIREAGGDATYLPMDVTRAEDWRRAVEMAETKYGKLNILVNNAGISRGPYVETTTLDTWEAVMEVNAKGVFLGTKYAIPAMRRADGGSIVNVGSISGMVGLGKAAYTASKGAVRAFTKVIAIQHAKDQIRCNSIHVGPVDTPMLQESRADPTVQVGIILAPEIPLGRVGTTEDVAYSVIYLASDEASFVTGAELVIDGGVTIM